MSEPELCYLSAVEAISLFKRRELSPVELMRAMIERAESVEPRINAFTDTYFEAAMAQAKKAESRYARAGSRPRALEGLAVAIKDETRIKGKRTTSGSLIFAGNVDSESDPVAERLLRAGAIVHARTATSEFCCAAITHSRLWGVTRNPWNLEFNPGGSSGGAGAALAAGTTTLANGSDIAGSIRIPSAACGVVGFKPPYGRNPETPVFNLDDYSHVGPMARTVHDCALLQNAMAGPHPRDITTLRPRMRLPQQLGDIRGWRVAYSVDLGYFEVDPEVRDNTMAVVDTFKDLGAEVEEVDLGWTFQCEQAALAHLHHLFGTVVAAFLPEHGDKMTDYARAFAERARQSTAQAYLGAMKTAVEMYNTLGPLLERCKVLVCPTLSVPAVPAEHNPTDRGFRVNDKPVSADFGWCMTYPFNMLGRCPVIAVPSGTARSGVPTGVQIVARSYTDVSAFHAAAALEQARPWRQRRPGL